MDGDLEPSVGQLPAAPPLEEPQLPVLRFGLRQFFWWITAASIVLAVLVAVPYGMSLIALVLAIGVVTLHVLSTAIGTRLRDHANERRAWEAAHDDFLQPSSGGPAVSLQPARRSPLHGHDQPLRRMRICLTAGAVLGGLLGIAALSVKLGDRTTIAG
ncbi:MAG: hypothetical protein AB7G28_24350, partial [Pirellulales bacterium]